MYGARGVSGLALVLVVTIPPERSAIMSSRFLPQASWIVGSGDENFTKNTSCKKCKRHLDKVSFRPNMEPFSTFFVQNVHHLWERAYMRVLPSLLAHLYERNEANNCQQHIEGRSLTSVSQSIGIVLNSILTGTFRLQCRLVIKSDSFKIETWSI